MALYIKTLDVELWVIIEDGSYPPSKIVNGVSISKSKKSGMNLIGRMQLNAKVVDIWF